MRLTPILFMALFLGGCASTPQMPAPLGLAYLTNKPLRLDVSRVEVVKQYQSSSKSPHVENDFPVPPVAMVQQWTQDRLLPVGKKGYAVVTIEDASVVEVPLKGTSGVRGFFTVDQSEQYDAKLSVKVEIFDDGGNSKGYAYARSQSSRTVSEDLTLGQRRLVWINMMEKLMNHLDEELERNVRTHLAKHVQ